MSVLRMSGSMMSLDMAYSSVRGNLHVIRELPNQDAIDVRELGDELIISLADGHGSNACFRSDLGSKMAVEIANDLITEKMDLITETPEKSKEICEELCKTIAESWSKATLRHLGENAFSDSEVDDLSEEKRKTLGKNALIAYGTTLMTVILSKNNIIVMNIGDAELLLKYKNKPDVMVLNQDKRVGNETESLALPFAHRYYTVDIYEIDEIEALLATTDGYPNSFKQEEGFIKVIDDLLSITKSHGIAAIQDNFETWLTDTSTEGSGDDITACFVTNFA